METVTLLAVIEGSRKPEKVKVKIGCLPPFMVTFEGVSEVKEAIKNELNMIYGINTDCLKIEVGYKEK